MKLNIDPPAIVRPAVDLASELAQADAQHEAGQRAERASLEHYRKAGESLLRAKAAAGRGNWLRVLKERSKIPQQRASEYMRLAEGWGKLPPGGSFALKEALRVIAGDDLDDVAEAVKAELKAGAEAMRDYLVQANALGLDLLDASRRLSHEDFIRMIEEAKISEEAANAYMRNARRRGWEPGEQEVETFTDRYLAEVLRAAGVGC